MCVCVGKVLADVKTGDHHVAAAEGSSNSQGQLKLVEEEEDEMPTSLEQLLVEEGDVPDEQLDKRGYVKIGKRAYVRIGKRAYVRIGKRDTQPKRRLARSVVEGDIEDPYARSTRGNFMRFGRGGDMENPAVYDDGFLRFGRGNFMRFGRR